MGQVDGEEWVDGGERLPRTHAIFGYVPQPPRGMVLFSRMPRLVSPLLDGFQAWLAATGRTPMVESEWDAALAGFLEVSFADGNGPGYGEKLLAALLWRLPFLSRQAGGRMVIVMVAVTANVVGCSGGRC